MEQILNGLITDRHRLLRRVAEAAAKRVRGDQETPPTRKNQDGREFVFSMLMRSSAREAIGIVPEGSVAVSGIVRVPPTPPRVVSFQSDIADRLVCGLAVSAGNATERMTKVDLPHDDWDQVRD